MRYLFLVALMGILFSFRSANEDTVALWLIGDSTMSIKETSAYPETGWGMPFTFFWDRSVRVENHAKNGRSTSSFRSEGRWDPIVSQLKEGDYVFIQFGHNDEVPTKATYTKEEDFRANLVRYVQETRARKAKAVLITPVARRAFDSAGHAVETHEVYARIVREVAATEKVALIDLAEAGKKLIEEFGVEESKLLFLHLAPGEHPNYPKGKEDNTHFSELGARLVAQLVLREIRLVCPELVPRIISPRQK